jgi:hypothetical protein
MNWLDGKRGDRRARLAYCLNLHAADTLDDTIGGIRSVTLPLRERLARGRRFGVGLYLPASVALPLASREGARDLDRFAGFLAEHALDPFTFNAFPFGGFHRSGLKAGVFAPTWEENERVEFTLAVARVATALARACGGLAAPAHVSISTHSGRFGAFALDERGSADDDSARRCAENMARVVAELARMENEHGLRVILALEPEPRASSGDLASLAKFLERAWRWGEAFLVREGAGVGDAAHDLMRRHLGTCLDCCHAAVEFERDAVERHVAGGSALGKLQFSSALSLRRPGDDRAGREALLALDEPRYLHQVTGACDRTRLRADDLAGLRAELASGATPWTSCDEWRCHFHVPVDLERVSAGGAGLRTTRDEADRILAQCLALARWNPLELHVEIETYTWDILPGAARGTGALVDGLEREYAHVMEELARAGLRRE